MRQKDPFKDPDSGLFWLQVCLGLAIVGYLIKLGADFARLFGY